MLLSSWCKDVKSLPEKYVFPLHQRPQELNTPLFDSPVIDLSKSTFQEKMETINQIIKAGEEFGFFQVINHGISQSLIDEAMRVAIEFYNMPAEIKASVFKPDPERRCRLYTSTLVYDTEKVHLWRDCLTHPCYPLDDCLRLWPEKPTKYREVMGMYSVEARKVILKILDLICEGLGLEEGYFDKNKMTAVQLLSLNYYPQCPEPSLALGMNKHRDPNIINILSQGDKSGLQVLKDGEWVGVEPIPNALVVILGCALQIVSNDKVKAAKHRVVTNSVADRMTISYFIIPSDDCNIEPAKSTFTHQNPLMYKRHQYKEFLKAHGERKGDFEPSEYFKLQG